MTWVKLILFWGDLWPKSHAKVSMYFSIDICRQFNELSFSASHFVYLDVPLYSIYTSAGEPKTVEDIFPQNYCSTMLSIFAGKNQCHSSATRTALSEWHFLRQTGHLAPFLNSHVNPQMQTKINTNLDMRQQIAVALLDCSLYCAPKHTLVHTDTV